MLVIYGNYKSSIRGFNAAASITLNGLGLILGVDLLEVG